MHDNPVRAGCVAFIGAQALQDRQPTRPRADDANLVIGHLPHPHRRRHRGQPEIGVPVHPGQRLV